MRVTPAGLRNGSFNLPDGPVPKDLAQSQTYRHYSKISKLFPTTGKHQKCAKKNKQPNVKQILKG